MENLTEKQIEAIKCAYADLFGAKEAHDNPEMEHDWEGHLQTIIDLEINFPFLDESTDNLN